MLAAGRPTQRDGDIAVRQRARGPVVDGQREVVQLGPQLHQASGPVTPAPAAAAGRPAHLDAGRDLARGFAVQVGAPGRVEQPCRTGRGVVGAGPLWLMAAHAVDPGLPPGVARRIAHAVGLGLRDGHRARRMPHLQGRARVVTEQPFLDDQVVTHQTVGHRGGHLRAARAGTIQAVDPLVRRTAGDAVRRVEKPRRVFAPDHVFGDDLPVGEGRQRRQRALHDGLHAAARAVQGVHHAAVGVMGAAQADVFLFPDAVGAAHDVVDDVAVHRLEAGQGLPARPFGQQVGCGATGRRTHLGQLVPGAGTHARYASRGAPTSLLNADIPVVYRQACMRMHT